MAVFVYEHDKGLRQQPLAIEADEGFSSSVLYQTLERTGALHLVMMFCEDMLLTHHPEVPLRIAAKEGSFQVSKGERRLSLHLGEEADAGNIHLEVFNGEDRVAHGTYEQNGIAHGYPLHYKDGSFPKSSTLDPRHYHFERSLRQSYLNLRAV